MRTLFFMFGWYEKLTVNSLNLECWIAPNFSSLNMIIIPLTWTCTKCSPDCLNFISLYSSLEILIVESKSYYKFSRFFFFFSEKVATKTTTNWYMRYLRVSTDKIVDDFILLYSIYSCFFCFYIFVSFWITWKWDTIKVQLLSFVSHYLSKYFSF